MILYPPNNLNRIPQDSLKVFLAGTIDMGNAPDWQSPLAYELSDMNYTVLNPRRIDWDSSWGNSFDDAQFAQQVNWELDALEKSDLILFYFAPKSNSIVSMLELGLMIGKYPAKVAVVCPEGYSRKGNIDILCYREKILEFSCIQDALASLAKIQIRRNIGKL